MFLRLFLIRFFFNGARISYWGCDDRSVFFKSGRSFFSRDWSFRVCFFWVGVFRGRFILTVRGVRFLLFGFLFEYFSYFI